MNSVERIVATVQFQEADRAPVIPQVFGHAATLANVPLDEYVRDGEILARCQLRALKRYGYDAVFSVMDVNVETEALGSALKYRKNQYPVIERHVLSGTGGRNLPPVLDPQQAGRMPQMLKALAILKGELGNETLIVGCILGPFTLATQLLGLETALYLAADDPGQLESILDFATEVVIRFGVAQVAAGAHLPVVFDPSASPAVVPPGWFREFEAPRLRRVFGALSAAGALANWLHIAGPVVPILPYYPKAGVHIANFDYCVSPEAAAIQLPTTCLDGNIKCLSFVQESPVTIEDEARNLSRFFRGRKGFILSSGCEIPSESNPENIAALVRAAAAK